MNVYVKFMRVTVAVLAATVASFFVMAADAFAESRVIIEITGFEFVMEQETELRPGDVVVWINRDIAPHTATAEDGSWNSGMLKTGESWEMVVTEEMSLSYYCVYHPSMTAFLSLETTPSDY